MSKKKIILPGAKPLMKRGSIKTKNERRKTLIVCEGTKTEPKYFKDMISDLRISNADVIIEPGKHSNPSSVVNTAIETYEKDRSFELIYCLIDTDEFGTDIDNARKIMREHNFSRRERGLGGPKLPEAFILQSNPCIEVWFILHFEMLTRSFVKNTKTAAMNCKGYLSDTWITDYCEALEDLYPRLKDKGGDAYKNSVSLKKWLNDNACEHPFTEVEILVDDINARVFSAKKGS